MEPKFQSSFIPKGPLTTAGTATHISQGADRSILGTIAVFVFVLSILVSLGIFGYEWYLRFDIKKMGQSLLSARTSLEPEVINKISSLDQRIVSTKALLDKHIVLSPLFDFLENSTLRTVRFSQFRYESADGKGLTLSMHGQARGYASLALQSQIFNASPYTKNVIFEDLSLDEKGNVTFSFKTDLDPSVISFRKGDEEETTSVPVVLPSAPTASTSTQTTSTSTLRTP
ncbi:MAG: hypothetical protein AAB660_00600 [Patescibacteria group bacterium]